MKRLHKEGGFTLIELLIVIIIIGILAAIAIPMFLNQRDKAKNAGVKAGVHNMQIGIQTWAVDNGDSYPAAALVDNQKGLTPSHIGDYVDNWPKNPWTAAPMASSANHGDFTYTQGANSTTFSLSGHMSNGNFTVP